MTLMFVSGLCAFSGGSVPCSQLHITQGFSTQQGCCCLGSSLTTSSFYSPRTIHPPSSFSTVPLRSIPPPCSSGWGLDVVSHDLTTSLQLLTTVFNARSDSSQRSLSAPLPNFSLKWKPRLTWIFLLALLPESCVAPDKLVKVSDPWLCYLKTGLTIPLSQGIWWGSNELAQVTNLVHSLLSF